MNKRAERIGSLVLAITLFATIAAAQLNPTVKVLSTPTGPIPETCTTGQSAQEQPRVDVAQIPEPASRVANVAPPSTSLRGLLHDIQSAADRNDRSTFRDALARTKGMLATYPPGGERTAATDLVRVYDDLDRVWAYQLDTPTGAFFDNSSVPAEVMRGYPGYERAIADQLFIDASGRRFYPTAETRDYLIREAAQRLNKLGVNVPMRVMRAPRVVPRSAPVETTLKPVREPRKGEKKVATTTAPTRHATPVPSTKLTPPTKKTHRPPVLVSEVNVAPRHTRKSTAPSPESKKSAPVVSKPPTKTTSKPSVTTDLSEASKKSSTTSSAAAPHVVTPPVTSHPAPVEAPTGPAVTKPPTVALPITPSPVTTSSAPAVSTAAPASPLPTEPVTTSSSVAPTQTTASTETTASSATDTTSSEEAKAQQPQGKGMILPIILIVIGVGVLIVLFRASS